VTTNNPFENVKAGVETAVAKVDSVASTVKADYAKAAAIVSTVKADEVKADNAAIAYVKANPKKIVAAVVSIAGAVLSHYVWEIL
jgi:hypothetical protein